MNRTFLTVTASAFLVAGAMGAAQAQSTTNDDDTMQQGQAQGHQQGQGMMQGHDGKKQSGKHGDRRSGMHQMMQRHMGYGMQGMGGMGGMDHGMGHRAVMEIVFAIADANGDGTLSLVEVQDVHARIFAHMDADHDGQLTKKEIKAFFHGGKDRHGSSSRDRSDKSDDKDHSGMPADSDDDDGNN